MSSPMSPPDLGGLSHELTIHVSWGHCDAAGVVFYPQYFAWFDLCTHALLDSVGLDHHHLRAHHGLVGTPLVDARAQFFAPATYGHELTARSWVAELGQRSFTVRHRLSRGESPLCEGHEKRVWAKADPADPLKLSSVPIPEPVRELLRAGSPR